jgi:hypothetical protein
VDPYTFAFFFLITFKACQKALQPGRAFLTRDPVRFLRRNQWLLCTLAVLVFSGIMVLRQFRANDDAHVALREDFILLHERGQTQSCQHLYEILIRQFPDLSDRTLVEDLERAALLVDPRNPTPDVDNPVWKYYVSVKRELQNRADLRVRALDHTEK